MDSLERSIQNRSLYAILDTGYVAHRDLLDVAKKLMDGGCTLIQYRDKNSAASDVIKNAEKLRKVIPLGVLFILNDDVNGAVKVGADGAHLGQEDMSIEKAREILGSEKILGLSTHSLEQALATRDMDVDYIGFGPIFKTKTKPLSKPTGLRDLPQIVTWVKHPVYAIGGIHLENVEGVMERGAQGVTVVSAILESQNIAETVSGFIAKIKKTRIQGEYVQQS